MLKLTDEQLFALNLYEEARNQCDDGVAAIGRVVLNRMKHHGPQSDGTVKGTILYPAAFSWTQYEMVTDPATHKQKYTKVVHTTADMEARVNALYDKAVKDKKPWARCSAIAAKVFAGEYAGADYDRLGDAAVNYYNPHVAHPSWADPHKVICAIEDHTFQRA